MLALRLPLPFALVVSLTLAACDGVDDALAPTSEPAVEPAVGPAADA